MNAGDFANDHEAKQVIGFMETGRWRKARDAAKDLCKRDRGRYLDLLIRANVGLVREMLGKGLVKDAEIVIVYLTSFAPAETIAMLRAEMAAPTGKRQTGAPTDSGEAGWWEVALRAEQALIMEGRVSPADQAVIDLLVTGSFEPDVASGDERAVHLAAQLKAVRAACAATGDGLWELAKDALRGLPRQSVFSQWRMFLRGVRCVFEDDSETARQCFAQLPQSGALAKAAATLAPDLAKSARPAPASAKIPFYLAATGQQAAWAAPLLASMASWRAGKRVQAFNDLALGLKEVFPSVVPGLPALLTDAILPSYARMNQQDWADSEAFYKRFIIGQTKSHSQITSLAILRSICVAEKCEMPALEVDSMWRKMIELWHDCHGPNPLRDSLAWQWLGETLEQVIQREPDSFGLFSSGKRDSFTKALKAYEKSVATDETNEPAWFALASLLVKQGDVKKSSQMLESLVGKFPHNKGMLTLAGDNALSRKSYAKGRAFLRAALALDPLDRDLKKKLVITLMSQVRDAWSKGVATHDLWEEIEPLLEDQPPNQYFMLSRWMIRVRQSLFGTDPAAIAKAEADAIAMAPSALVRIFFTATVASIYGTPFAQGSKQGWKAAYSSPKSDWKSLLEILRILNFVSDISGWGIKQKNAAQERILAALAHLLSPLKIKEDPQGVIEFLDEMRGLSKSASPSVTPVFSAVQQKLIYAFHRRVDPASRKMDPRLRLANLSVVGHPSKFALKCLIQVIADAQTLGLHAIASQAEVLRQAVERKMHEAPFGFCETQPFDGNDDGDDDDDDDDGDDIWDDDDDDDFGDDRATDLELARVLEALGKALAACDEGAVKQARKSLSNLGMTKGMIDRIIGKIGNPASSTGSKKPAKKAGKKTAKKAVKKTAKKAPSKSAQPQTSDPVQGDRL